MEGDAAGADGGRGGGGERSSFVIGLIENRAKEVSHALKPLRISPVARSIRANWVDSSRDPVILRPAPSQFVIRLRVGALQLCELLLRRIACFDWFADVPASSNCLLPLVRCCCFVRLLASIGSSRTFAVSYSVAFHFARVILLGFRGFEDWPLVYRCTIFLGLIQLLYSRIVSKMNTTVEEGKTISVPCSWMVHSLVRYSNFRCLRVYSAS
jgi:hypothetical protein